MVDREVYHLEMLLRLLRDQETDNLSRLAATRVEINKARDLLEQARRTARDHLNLCFDIEA